jgi:formylglycine-generating enzyme
MRIKIKHFSIIGCLSIFAFTFYSKQSYQKKEKAPAPDMILIKGEGEIEPFYMSVIEEPNINYVMYLQWIDRVYGSQYPDIFVNALPNIKEYSTLYSYNDPQIQNYMLHPAFRYYPVVGLSYDQIQNYLIWKTDRLNESILIEKGYQNPDWEQRNENTFNTEAVLCGQYLGSLRKLLQDKGSTKERTVQLKDNILKPSFRLPTEAEWVHASQFLKPLDRKRYAHPFSNATNKHPFGKNYYPLFGDEGFRALKDFGYAGIHSQKYNTPQYFEGIDTLFYDINADYDAKKFNIGKKDIVNGQPTRLTTITDYDAKSYGLANMASGVKEWVFDGWEPIFDVKLQNTDAIFEKNKAKQGLILDENQLPVERDFLGRMRGHKNPARLLGKKGENEGIFWSFEYAEKPSFEKPSQYTPVNRVIRGGTYKNPSVTTREKLLETTSSGEVGFRVVMPY